MARRRPSVAADRVVTMPIPAEYVQLADRRLAAIIRRCCWDENIVESIARSCYLQGVIDGAMAAAKTPELVAALQQVDPEKEEPCHSKPRAASGK